jgi:4-amino-4-deoxychorismate lyase
MSRLLESIRYEHGQLHNLAYHEARMAQAVFKIFGKKKTFHLAKEIRIPNNLDDALYKCRIVYDTEIRDIEFSIYERKKIDRYILVVDEHISYAYKYENRDCINRHTQNLAPGTEVIFVKKGLIRDASYSNIALYNGTEWHTPKYPLLKGTKRAELLDKKILKSKMIRPKDFKNYQRICFITALNDLGQLCLDI